MMISLHGYQVIVSRLAALITTGAGFKYSILIVG